MPWITHKLGIYMNIKNLFNDETLIDLGESLYQSSYQEFKKEK